jgi:hypothetical protein
MKVMYTMKNMMIQEFQHFVEFELIEVMKMKIQMIQFESIVMVTRITLTEAQLTGFIEDGRMFMVCGSAGRYG